VYINDKCNIRNAFRKSTPFFSKYTGGPSPSSLEGRIAPGMKQKQLEVVSKYVDCRVEKSLCSASKAYTVQ
jgi:hypothetical protein